MCSAAEIGIAASNYAAQLSWWFSFFPPDSFLILSSTDVETKDLQDQANILNRIKAHAGVSGENFTVPKYAPGIQNRGRYNLKRIDVEDAKAMLALRLLHQQPLADLNAFLRKHYQPDFPDLVEEISDDELRSHIKTHSLIRIKKQYRLHSKKNY